MQGMEELRDLIDEEGFPYFEEAFLHDKMRKINKDFTIKDLARELCLVKAGIEEVTLGDVVIPSPKNHFLRLASRYRKSYTGIVGRSDEY